MEGHQKYQQWSYIQPPGPSIHHFLHTLVKIFPINNSSTKISWTEFANQKSILEEGSCIEICCKQSLLLSYARITSELYKCQCFCFWNLSQMLKTVNSPDSE